MKAITIVPGTPSWRLVDRPEPEIRAADEVKLRVERVGVCGTDREQAAGGRARAPEGRQDLVVGHEMVGRVVATGPDVTRVRAGDWAAVTVRRGCGHCAPCQMDRSDMCRTGDYRERGIWAADGYQTEFVVDAERYVFRIPPEVGPLGVLTEPLSVAEKAIDEVTSIQRARLPDAASSHDWLKGRRCLVAGLGPIGLLAALALRLREAEVWGLDVVAPDTARPVWLNQIGGHYLEGRDLCPDVVADRMGSADVILEATGAARVAFGLFGVLAPDGACVLTGIPDGRGPLEIPGARVIRELVLGNRALVGSVNAAPIHYQIAIDDLGRARLRWGPLIGALITSRRPPHAFTAALEQHGPGEIKVVVEWAR